MNTRKYQSADSALWDHFIDSCRNSLFLFKRSYMEYHKDRFVDNSLLFYENNRLLAVLPASIQGNELYSHAGLTFGGLLYPLKLGVTDILKIFESLISYMNTEGFTKINYKVIPYIFHTLPTEEDLYVLSKFGARMIKRELSTAVCFDNRIKFSKGKREGVKKAVKQNLVFSESDDFEQLFEIGTKIMKDRHD